MFTIHPILLMTEWTSLWVVSIRSAREAPLPDSGLTRTKETPALMYLKVDIRSSSAVIMSAFSSPSLVLLESTTAFQACRILAFSGWFLVCLCSKSPYAYCLKWQHTYTINNSQHEPYVERGPRAFLVNCVIKSHTWICQKYGIPPPNCRLRYNLFSGVSN